MAYSEWMIEHNPELLAIVGRRGEKSGDSPATLTKNPATVRRQDESSFQRERTKYNAIPTVYETVYGPVRFPSKKEAAEAQKIDLEVRSGKIKGYLMQVPFKLPGGVVHRVDFGIINLDGTVTWREVKGKDLGLGKLKRKQTCHLYHIEIEVV